MNTSIIQMKQEDAHFAVDYCKRTFNAPGQQVVNAYKCNQGKLTTADIWNIQRQRRQIIRGPGIRVI